MIDVRHSLSCVNTALGLCFNTALSCVRHSLSCADTAVSDTGSGTGFYIRHWSDTGFGAVSDTAFEVVSDTASGKVESFA